MEEEKLTQYVLDYNFEDLTNDGIVKKVILDMKNSNTSIAKECLIALDILQNKIQKQEELISKLNYIKNRKKQGANQENINKMASVLVNSWLEEVK